MKKILLVILLIPLLSFYSVGQDIKDIHAIKAPNNFDNVHVYKLHSDSLVTSLIIWVKKEVKAHKHVNHSESIYVLEGTGKMKIGSKEHDISPGNFFNIPQNTPHSLVVTSSEAIKVISIQAPEFNGNDRIFMQ